MGGGGGGCQTPPHPPPPLGDAELFSKTLGHGEERAAARHAHSAGGMQAMAALHTRVHEPQGEDWGWAGGTLTYLSQNQPHDVHHGVGAGGGGGSENCPPGPKGDSAALAMGQAREHGNFRVSI